MRILELLCTILLALALWACGSAVQASQSGVTPAGQVQWDVVCPSGGDSCHEKALELCDGEYKPIGLSMSAGSPYVNKVLLHGAERAAIACIGTDKQQKLVAERKSKASRDYDAASQRAGLVCVSAPWIGGPISLESAEKEASSSRLGSKPSGTFAQFADWNEWLREFDSLRCSELSSVRLSGREAFERVWKLLQAQEAKRSSHWQYYQQEDTALTEYTARLETAKDEARSRTATNRGFSEVRVGLMTFLQDVRNSGMPIDQVRKVAVELSNGDQHFTLRQVLGDRGLVIDEGVQLLIQGKKGAFYEGTPLTNLGYSTYRVAGTESYQSASGLRQAFVALPVDDFNVDEEAANDVAQTFVRGTDVSFSQYSERRLLECIDIHSADIGDKLKTLTGPTIVFIHRSCSEQFARPPIATCSVKDRFSYFLYARRSDSNSMTDAACARAGGVWDSKE